MKDPETVEALKKRVDLSGKHIALANRLKQPSIYHADRDFYANFFGKYEHVLLIHFFSGVYAAAEYYVQQRDWGYAGGSAGGAGVWQSIVNTSPSITV